VGILRILKLARSFRKHPEQHTREVRQRRVRSLVSNLLRVLNIQPTEYNRKFVPKGAALIVANHKSNVDALSLIKLLGSGESVVPLTFVTKTELSKKKVTKAVLELLEAVMLDRESPREAGEAALAISERLRQGYQVCVFAEGTRNDDPNIIGEFKAGALKPAYRAYRAILPVSIVFSENVLSKKGPLDLLLHLVKERKLDLLDLDVRSLADQYLTMVTTNASTNLEEITEYLGMATYLIELKSRMVIPPPGELGGQNEADLERDRLVARLLEYSSYKAVIPGFYELWEKRSRIYLKRASALDQDIVFNQEAPLPEGVDPIKIHTAMQKIYDRLEE
ncbi:unnamed protein product, partial [Didymodactylos carnosus]